MIKNLLGKKESKLDAEKDQEVQKLREKFNNIVNSQDKGNNSNNAPQIVDSINNNPGNNNQTNNSGNNNQITNSNNNNQLNNSSNNNMNNNHFNINSALSKGKNPSQYQYMDPERVEESERITNLIMQQIKELIEIDNNLNAKIKEIENKIGEYSSTLASTKSTVEQFNTRLELIEKNMEKFMGLYEVVTNRFNPFVSEDESESELSRSDSNTISSSLSKSQESKSGLQDSNEFSNGSSEKGGLVNLDEARKKAGKSISSNNAGGLNNNSIQSNKGNGVNNDNDKKPVLQPIITNEVREIIDDSGVQSKLNPSQQIVVRDELSRAIGLVGSDAFDGIKKEISEHLGKVIGEHLNEAMQKHIKLSNDEIKSSMRDMLLETIAHIQNHVDLKTQQNNMFNSNNPLTNQSANQSANNQSANNQSANNQSGSQSNNNTNAPSQMNNSIVNQEIHPDFHFILPNGTEIKTIADLKNSLKTMDNATFNSHVNQSKNDFAEWIKVVFNRDDIANQLTKEKSRVGILNVLETIQ